MNVSIMTADELVKYAKTNTELEVALMARLKEAVAEIEAFKDVLDISHRGFIESAEDLDKYLDEIELEAAAGANKEDYDDYKSFFREIVSYFEDHRGAYPAAEPSDDVLRESIKEEFDFANFYTPSNARKG
jgi:hypothetical protein